MGVLWPGRALKQHDAPPRSACLANSCYRIALVGVEEMAGMYEERGSSSAGRGDEEGEDGRKLYAVLVENDGGDWRYRGDPSRFHIGLGPRIKFL